NPSSPMTSSVRSVPFSRNWMCLLRGTRPRRWEVGMRQEYPRPNSQTPLPGGAMLNEFRDFLLRGNIVELAIAFVLGVAFGALVTSFVNNLLTPIVAMIVGKPDFRDLTFTINDAVFRYGAFITDAIAFVSIAAAV